MKHFPRKSPYRYLTLGIFALITLILVTGCSGIRTPESLPSTPTVTETTIPTPTIDWFPATTTPTYIPSTTPTLAIIIEGQQQGIKEMLINDDFSDPSLWQTSQNSTGNVAFGNQNLTLAVASQGSSLSSLSQHELPPNFYLEITIQTSLCQPQDQVGMNFWYQSSSDFYRLLINCAGQYRLELIQGGLSYVLRNWESATQIQPGAPASNRVGIWAYQGQLELYFNDAFQIEERVALDRSGGLSVFARSIESSAMTVKFSDLRIFRVERD
jgi:hypothetical protein